MYVVPSCGQINVWRLVKWGFKKNACKTAHNNSTLPTARMRGVGGIIDFEFDQ